MQITIMNKSVLDSLNADIAAQFIPLIVLLALAMTIGLSGNLAVMYRYGTQSKLTSSEIFIIALSLHDFLTCLIGIPSEIADLLHPLNFSSVEVCKLLKGLQAILVMTSSLLFLLITYDRYRRICKFGKMMTLSKTKRVCVLSFVLGAVSASPIFVFYGEQEVHLPTGNLTGVACTIADHYQGSIAILIYYGVIVVYFVCCVIIIIVAYSLIRSRISKTRTSIKGRRKASAVGNIHSSNSRSSMSSTRNPDINIFRASSAHEIANRTRENIPMGNMNAQTPSEAFTEDSQSNQAHPRNLTSVAKTRRQKPFLGRTRRMTFLFMYVSFGFIITFLPFLTAVILRSAIKHFEERLSTPELVFFKFCLKSYFLSSVINPLIYGIFNYEAFKNACCCPFLVKWCN